MSAQVIDFASAAARRQRSAPLGASIMRAAAPRPPLTHDFKFWTGASGKRYVHTLHGLIDCPEVDNCNLLLVRAEPSGRREVLHVGHVECDVPSLNLAEIRRLGATLGANEVHVHLLPVTAAQRRFVEIDLQAALAGCISTRASAG